MQTKEQLIGQFNAVVDSLTDRLCEMWEIYAKDNDWVADDRTGVYCISDWLFLNLGDIVYIVENGLTEKEVSDWQDYNTKASDFGFNLINLKSWHKGCPRVTDETFDRLQAMRDNLNDLVEIEKRRLKGE